ncbi:hypothetical protein BBJ28_00018927 [Nothophytophthora sp. Chile5]|nr:hypothetical protein BBJ28_00018927 [Nothophytophthora sp. Chile5]
MKVSACLGMMAPLALLALADAWMFDASDVAPPEDILGEHQPLQRTWTISSQAQLEKLYLAIPGRVFVDLDPSLLPPPPPTEAPAPVSPETEAPETEVPETEAPAPAVVPISSGSVDSSSSGAGSQWNSSSLEDDADTIQIPTTMLRKHHHHHEDSDDEPKHKREEDVVVARVVITGNSTELLDMIEAVPLHPKRDDGLKLHLKNEDAYGEGYVLTQIYVYEKNLLRYVNTAFSGDVVLDEAVVALEDEETRVKLSCVGDGNLYLDSSANASLDSLDVTVTGAGVAQLQLAGLSVATALDLEVAGNGIVALITDAVTASDVSATVSGPGDIVVETADFEAETLTTSVYGPGTASFATAGAVEKETLSLSGPGQLYAGSIVAKKATTDVWGDGEMLVQVTDKLTVSTSVWGKVGYVNAPPADVKIKGWWFWREADTIVYPAAVNKVLIYEPTPVPAKYPVYYAIETVKSVISDDPDFAFVSVEAASVVELMTSSLASVHEAATGSNGVFYAFAGVGVLVVNVVAARAWAQRRVRRHYTRLE